MFNYVNPAGANVANTERSLVLMSPTYAQELLEKNIENRRLNQSHVRRLANIIKQGRWGLAPSNCIIIDDKGVILDGQHRLHAIISAGISVPIFLEIGWPNETKYYIDFDSKTRTRADVVSTLHRKYTNNLSAFLTHVSFFVNNKKDLRTNPTFPLNKQEKILKLLEHFDLDKLVYYISEINARSSKGNCNYGISYFSTVFYLLDEAGIITPEGLEELMDKLFLGLALDGVTSYPYRMRKIILNGFLRSGKGYAFSSFFDMLVNYLKAMKYIKSEDQLLEAFKQLAPEEMILIKDKKI